MRFSVGIDTPVREEPALLNVNVSIAVPIATVVATLTSVVPSVLTVVVVPFVIVVSFANVILLPPVPVTVRSPLGLPSYHSRRIVGKMSSMLAIAVVLGGASDAAA